MFSTNSTCYLWLASSKQYADEVEMLWQEAVPAPPCCCIVQHGVQDTSEGSFDTTPELGFQQQQQQLQPKSSGSSIRRSLE